MTAPSGRVATRAGALVSLAQPRAQDALAHRPALAAFGLDQPVAVEVRGLPDHVHDLAGMAAGVLPEGIHTAPICTMCRTDLFFSYRKEKSLHGKVGRLMAVVGRK